MIVITKVESFECDGDVCKIPIISRFDAVSCLQIDSETVHGRMFTNPETGKDIVIGMTKEVGDILNLQYDSWEQYKKEQKQFISYCLDLIQHNNQAIYHKTLVIQAIKAEKNRLKNAKFLQRLKWLFTGVE